MKAVCYEGMKNVKVKEVDDPRIQADDDVIIKVTSTAICGSDLHLIDGMTPNMPKGFRAPRFYLSRRQRKAYLDVLSSSSFLTSSSKTSSVTPIISHLVLLKSCVRS